MGEVYLAEDSKLRRKIALKLLSTELTKDQDRLRRFEQEAFAASALSHPNILVVHDIDSDGDAHFIATEFIEGETLRDRMTRSKLSLQGALEIAIQTASALAAAHKAGIVHRDIKPENIMLREDGYAKVLDFGLAKLTERTAQTSNTEAQTIARVDTDPGTVLGTVNYMSPEQARGRVVDERTDIFSLGVVTYEMIAGRVPFEGESSTDVLAAILDREPAPLARFEPETPAELQRIMGKSLCKNRDERYQTVKDLLIDLKNLREELTFEEKLERSISPDSAARMGITTSGAAASLATSRTPAQSDPAAPVRTTSSAEYIVSEIKRHKKGFGFIAAAVVLAAVSVFLYFNRASALSERDTIVLADFVNTTGDAVFDGTLKQALAVQLGQSPFLNIFSDDRAREALRFMGRSPDDRITRDIAREICERHGLKALLAGSISNIGSHYILLLEAVNGHTGDSLAREQVEAESKEQVLGALGKAASRLREKLGESLASIQKFDAPIEQATTSSLEALKAFTLGHEQRDKAADLEAIPFYRRAIELDPNFALAYAELSVVYYNSDQAELAAELAEKAFALRDRVSEREKLYISSQYYGNGTREIEKDIEVLELWKRTYPRDHIPHNILSVDYREIGQFEKAAEEARETIRLNPNFANGYGNLGRAFLKLNRIDEAKETFQRGIAQNIDGFQMGLYQVAFLQGDQAALQQHVEWFKGKVGEFNAEHLQALSAAFYGQVRKAREFETRAIDLALRRDVKEVAAFYSADSATREAFFDNCDQAKEQGTKALAITRGQDALVGVAGALAKCGDARSAQSLVDELAKKAPKDTLLNTVALPLIRAELELSRGNSSQAIQLLETTNRYAHANLFAVSYARARAHLREQKSTEAIAEFQKILDHRGEGPLSPLYPLAQLGLARAALLSGETAKARKAYQDFFAIWKDADPDLRILIEAKKEYERLN